uniref:Prokineticin domain-containing protein n=2 Tax=Branchiostoma floridae TaxID=7739 RepID=C3ZA67_BRAFL|eukprot:XP_002594644.1 hypothetical protein BRAFLDRAFT_77623 [Branchiostoma floridae]
MHTAEGTRLGWKREAKGNQMIRFTIILLLAVWAAIPTIRAIIITGACRSDEDCMEGKGRPACCSPLNPYTPVRVCKPLGAVGDPCHTATNRMRYPFPGIRTFWRCPCFEGWCVAKANGKIGTCEVVMHVGCSIPAGQITPVRPAA